MDVTGKMSTAVLFIIFNRPDTTAKVFEAIRRAQPAKLYIAADAPREDHPADEANCAKARSVTETIDWPCEVKRLYQSVNLGCSRGPRAAFNWFFAQEPEGIILEDDCVPHPDFFSFAAEMLHRYRNNPQIISINGSSLGYRLTNGCSHTFSRYMNMWGWATWADRARAVDYELHEWKQIANPLWWLYRHMRRHVFDADIHWYRYWKDKFDRTINEKNITWWDWQWIFHQLKNRQLSVVPARNLVTNIGFTHNATHTRASDNPAANLPCEALPATLIHPEKIRYDRYYEKHFVKWVWCYHRQPSVAAGIKHTLSYLLRNL